MFHTIQTTVSQRPRTGRTGKTNKRLVIAKFKTDVKKPTTQYKGEKNGEKFINRKWY